MIDLGSEVVVLGLGNVLLSDDGVGVRAVQRLRDDPRLPPTITLIDGGTLGLELLSCAAGARRVLVVDAIEGRTSPGTLVRFGHDELQRLAGGASAHELGLADLLAALRLLGREPEEMILLGIQPASLALGTALSPTVAAALDGLVDAVLAEIERWVGRGEADEPSPAIAVAGDPEMERSRLCVAESPRW